MTFSGKSIQDQLSLLLRKAFSKPSSKLLCQKILLSTCLIHPFQELNINNQKENVSHTRRENAMCMPKEFSCKNNIQ